MHYNYMNKMMHKSKDKQSIFKNADIGRNSLFFKSPNAIFEKTMCENNN